MDLSVLTDVGNCSVDQGDLYDSGTRYLKKSSIGRKKTIALSQNVSPNAALGALYQGSSTVNNILLPQGDANVLSVCESLVLEITLQNTDAVNAATILPTMFIVSQIQVNTNQTLETINSEHLLIKRVFLSEWDSELDQRSQLENFTYSYPAGFVTNTTTIAASGSAKYYLEIPCCLTGSGLFLPAVQQQITLMITFPPSCVTSTSTSQTVSCTNMRLFLNGYDFEPQVRRNLLNKFASRSMIYGYCFPMIEQLSNITVSSATESNFAISTFTDFLTPCIFLMVRAVNSTQQNLYAFDQIATLDLRKDGASTKLSTLDRQEYSSMLMKYIKTSVPNSNTNILCDPFAIDVYQALKHNRLNGYLKFSPNINAIIRMQSVSGQRDLIAVVFRQGVLQVQDGNLSYVYLNDQRR